VTDSSNKPLDLAALDKLTGGAFTVSTSADRTARLRDWLAGQPTLEQVQAAFDEMSHRDKGAAKVLREKLDELRRSKDQDALIVEWASKGEALRDAPHINLSDAMGWQRDAAKAGAPLSREPLAGLKTALAERVKAIEDLQHQTQVQREAAVLLAQRIEVLSTKPWQDALAQRDALQTDLDRWVAQAQALAADAQWPSVDAKFAPALQTSTQQVQAVWTAFGEALILTEAAAADAAAPLPAVPAWSDQIRVARGEVLPQAAAPVKAAKPAAAGADATRKVKPTADKAVVDQKRLELAMQAEALFKPAPVAKPAKAKAPKADEAALAQDAAVVEQVAVEVTQAAAVDAPAVIEAAAAETVAADVVTTVAAPAQKPAAAKADDVARVPAVGGRKMQETLRNLREQWKKIDKEAAPNPALWKRFDSACNRAHEVVDAWLKEARAQTTAHKAQRLALIEEVKAWAVEHANGPDWKGVARQLHQFAQRWRESGHLSEKMFAELQPVWKAAIHAAHEPLEAVQKASLARRHGLIAEAQALGAAPSLRVDAVKALQQRWQEEAHAVVLDRKQEQKLWDAFRQPIDEAFARKSSVREQSQAALTPHDKAVLDAAKALDSATAKGDASAIRAAMQMLEQIARGEVVAPVAAPVHAAAAPAAATEASAEVVTESEAPATEVTPDASAEAASSDAAHSSDDTSSEASAENSADNSAEAAEPVAEVAPVKPKAAPRPVVAVRGDDRPGQKRTEAAPAGRGRDGKPSGKFGDKPGFGRDGKPGRDGGRDGGREGFAPRGPRLGDAAFRAQRFALESAQDALRRLASQAHGEVLTQLMHAWEKRDAAQLPAAQAIGNKLSPAQRTQWSQALSAQPQGEAVTPLLRLEVAADLPTPAAQMDARRALQLQMLTRRNDPSPQMTWAADAAQVLGGAYDEAAARRLQAALKVLLKR
jgi:hypothetical protein